ncbi:MAG: type II secretion system protein [Kiritimatiellae bacterium]|nr:type II secretion system protein [Kiritimatiellia bacterium]
MARGTGAESGAVWARGAFTIVELLVVIGIIGVLAGVLLASFTGGTEAARAAKCLSNMRNLAQGAISYAARHGDYPNAGSCAAIDMDVNGVKYYEHVGWISWLSKNDEYHSRRSRGGSVGSFQKCPNVSAYCTDDKDADFAITNGVLWKRVGQNRDTYICPSHAIQARKHAKTARFSYAMSAHFGYDWTRGSDAAESYGRGGVSMSESNRRFDRTLLFAELPFAIPGANDSANEVSEDTAYSTGNDTELVDCVLQYNANVNGKAYHGPGREWSGTAEAIHFNHRSGKRYCAHVVFADGHVEKLLLPKKKSGGLNSVQLTGVLCGGVDVTFDGSTYRVATGADK